MNKQKIRLDLVTVDAGTQQRPIDDEVLSRYLLLMADGVEFPPVDVVSDGPNFWLWDGFHRLECARRRQQQVVSAYVTKGTLRDATWLGFGANKAHGLPRQKGVARKIVAAILTDSSWSKKSLSAIGRHVGVSKQYVSLVKEELAGAEVSSKPPKVGKSGDSEPETAQGSSTLPLSRAGEIEVETKAGIPYTQRSQEKEHKPDEPKDGVGRVIPEHLRDLYASRSVILKLVNNLSQIRDTVTAGVDAKNQAFALLNQSRFQVDYMNLRRTLKSALPYAVCPYCGGDGDSCTACHGLGLLNKHSYEAAPKELK